MRPHARTRRRRATPGAVLVTLLVLTTGMVVAQGPGSGDGDRPRLLWGQAQGDAERSSTVELPPGPLDLLAIHRFLEFPDVEERLEILRGAMIETPHGLFVGAWNEETDDCFLVRIDPDDLGTDRFASGVERIPLDAGCLAVSVTIYDGATDRLILCGAGVNDAPLLGAWDLATRTYAWSISARDLKGLLTDPTARTEFTCLHPAFDRSRDAIVFTVQDGEADARVVRVSSSGSLQWATPIGPDLFEAPPSASGVKPLVPRPPVQARYVHRGLALTTTGIAFTGVLIRSCCTLAEFPLVAEGTLGWMEWDGRVSGGLRAGTAAATDDPATLHYRTYGSNWPSAERDLAAAALGGNVVLVNPTDRDPLRVEPHRGVESGQGYNGVQGTAWWRDVLLVPLGASVTRYDPDDLASPRWSWSPGPGLDSSQVLIAPPDSVWVVMTDCPSNNSCRDRRFYRLDLETGGVTQRLDVSGTAARGSGNRWLGSFTPISDGRLLVAGDPGEIFVLGRSDTARQPRLEVPDLYPAAGDRVALKLHPPVRPEGIWGYEIFWGDGESTPARTSGEYEHRYSDEGERVIRVTAVFSDQTTATREIVLQVGGVPPPELNLLQRAFAAENQDLTFGVLGLGVAGAGGLLAVAKQRRRHLRLERELKLLDEAYAANRDHPARGEAALAERKAHVEAMLLDRKLESDQAAMLDRRVEELRYRLRMELLDQRFAFLPHGLVLTLRDMLADGRINGWERDHVLRALDADAVLTPEQKLKVRVLVEEWFERDRGGTERAPAP